MFFEFLTQKPLPGSALQEIRVLETNQSPTCFQTIPNTLPKSPETRFPMEFDGGFQWFSTCTVHGQAMIASGTHVLAEALRHVDAMIQAIWLAPI